MSMYIKKLSSIKQEFRYPREDMYELLNKVDDLKFRLEHVEADLSEDPEKDSWKKQVNINQKELYSLYNQQKSDLDELENNCKQEFEIIRHENQEKLAKITSDSKVLDSVREIANFLKQIK